MAESPFQDEWRAALRAHYMHVIRENDTVTRPSLARVLHSLGFSDVELKELEVLAFARVEDAPDDFVPDLRALAEAPKVHPAVVAPTAPALEDGTAEYDAALIDAPDDADDAVPDDDAPSGDAPSGDAPQQLSLF